MRPSKLFRTLLYIGLALAMIMPLAVPAAAANTTAVSANTATAVVNTGALNVRSGPGIGYNAIAIVYQGTSVTLIGRNAASTWANIRLNNNVEGWVNASLLSTSTAISTLPLSSTPTLTATAVVNTGAANVRSGPSLAYNATAIVYQGSAVTLLGRNANSSWLLVRLSNGHEGWTNAALLNANVAVGSLPVANAPAAPIVPTGVVTASYLNVRSGPDVSFGVNTTLTYGESVGLIGRNSTSTWANIRLATGHEGWVNASYLNLNVGIGSLPVAGADQPAVVPTAVIATSALNMRTGPGVAYGVVTVLTAGQSADPIGRTADGSWLKLLRASGHEGWVNASYVTINVPLSSVPVLVDTTTQANAVVATGALNVRYGPDVSYAAFAIAYQGTAVNLIGRNAAGTWVKIRLSDGNEGWVNASYLTTSVNIGSLPQAW